MHRRRSPAQCIKSFVNGFFAGVPAFFHYVTELLSYKIKYHAINRFSEHKMIF